MAADVFSSMGESENQLYLLLDLKVLQISNCQCATWCTTLLLHSSPVLADWQNYILFL